MYFVVTAVSPAPLHGDKAVFRDGRERDIVGVVQGASGNVFRPPIRKGGANEQMLLLAGFHLAVAGQNFQAGEWRFFSGRTGRPLPYPREQDFILAGRGIQTLAAPMRHFGERLAQEKAVFGVFAADAPPAQLPRDGRNIHFGRIPAQAQTKAALALRRAVTRARAAPQTRQNGDNIIDKRNGDGLLDATCSDLCARCPSANLCRYDALPVPGSAHLAIFRHGKQFGRGADEYSVFGNVLCRAVAQRGRDQQMLQRVGGRSAWLRRASRSGRQRRRQETAFLLHWILH